MSLQFRAGGPVNVFRREWYAFFTRKLRDAEIAPQLLELWEENDFVYGVRKFWKVAKRARIDIGRDQTARFMNLLGVEDMRRE